MAKIKIVVIDDEVNVRETITEILTFHGYEVFAAAGGKLGFQLVSQVKPDLVLCDITMPEMDGYEVLARIRGEERLKSLPFLFISAKNDADSVRLGMNLGSDDYLSKPFKAADLISAIEAKLKRFNEFRDSLNTEINQLQDHFSKFGFQELNVPVNGILGVIDFMQEYDHMLQSSERQEFLARIRQSVYSFRRSYSNLTLYLKIISGEQIYDSKRTCLTTEVVASAKEKLKVIHPSSVLPPFDLELARLPMHCHALELILFELLDNVIRHAENEKSPEVMGRWTQEDSVYVIRVSDFGAGLSADKIKKIQATMRLDRELVNDQGWGLGLFLTRFLTEQANGTFLFTSSEGLGCQVEISIPVQR